jgi:hypothetical protein
MFYGTINAGFSETKQVLMGLDFGEVFSQNTGHMEGY